MLRHEGVPVKDVCEELGMHASSITKICARYKAQDLEEFARNKYTSHSCSLSYEEEEILQQFKVRGEKGQQVTVKEIKAAFDERRGKDTGRGYIYMVLKRHGWRKVMPRSKHPKAANEEAIEASKKVNPSSKKSWQIMAQKET